MGSPLTELLDLPDDALWERLGRETTRGIGTRDPRFLQAAARAWLDDKFELIKETICGDPRVLAARSAAASDEALVAAAVFDALAPLFDLPVATTASVLIVRLGISRFCGEMGTQGS